MLCDLYSGMLRLGLKKRARQPWAKPGHDGENKASSRKKYSLPAAYVDAYAACPGHLSRQGAGTGGPTSRAMTEIKLQYVNVNAGWYKRSER